MPHASCHRPPANTPKILLQPPIPDERGKKTFFILCQQRAGLCLSLYECVCVCRPCLCVPVGLCVCLHKDLSVNVGVLAKGAQGAAAALATLLSFRLSVRLSSPVSVSCSSGFVLLINRLLLLLNAPALPPPTTPHPPHHLLLLVTLALVLLLLLLLAPSFQTISLFELANFSLHCLALTRKLFARKTAHTTYTQYFSGQKWGGGPSS